VMPTMRAVAATALEAPSAAIRSTITATIGTAIRSTVAAAMGTIRAPIGASPASAESPAITAAIASSALRALETGTRIGADAGEVFARRVWITRAAGFSRQKNSVVFNDGFDGRTVRRDRSRHGFRRDMFDGFVMSEVGALGFGHLRAIFFRVGFLACFAMLFLVAGFRGELRFAGFLFRVFTVFAFFALILLFFGFFFVLAVFLVLGNFVCFVERFGFVLVKIGPTDESVGFGARLGFFVLGFHQASGEGDGLFIAEGWSGVASRFG